MARSGCSAITFSTAADDEARVTRIGDLKRLAKTGPVCGFGAVADADRRADFGDETRFTGVDRTFERRDFLTGTRPDHHLGAMRRDLEGFRDARAFPVHELSVETFEVLGRDIASLRLENMNRSQEHGAPQPAVLRKLVRVHDDLRTFDRNRVGHPAVDRGVDNRLLLANLLRSRSDLFDDPRVP